MFALAEVGPPFGRAVLCRLLATLVTQGERVRVVFDGPPQEDSSAAEIAASGVDVQYSAKRSADEILIELIDADTAPRRLTVVSSDREIRKAARRRRCIVKPSNEFARELLRIVKGRTARESRPPTEPKEKLHGLTDQQTKDWLKEFGIE
jgi:hypothetical protein